MILILPFLILSNDSSNRQYRESQPEFQALSQIAEEETVQHENVNYVFNGDTFSKSQSSFTSSTIYVSSTIFNGCFAIHAGLIYGSGGAIFAMHSQLYIGKDSAFFENEAIIGGALFLFDSDCLITNGVNFTGNRAYYAGGAIISLSDVHSNFLRCDQTVFEGNYAREFCGAVCLKDLSDCWIESCLFQNNTALHSAGAIGIYECCHMFFFKSSFFDNKSGGKAMINNIGHTKSFRSFNKSLYTIYKGGGAILYKRTNKVSHHSIFGDDKNLDYENITYAATEKCCFAGNICEKSQSEKNVETKGNLVLQYDRGFDLLIIGNARYQSYEDRFVTKREYSIGSFERTDITDYFWGSRFYDEGSKERFVQDFQCEGVDNDHLVKYYNLYQVPETFNITAIFVAPEYVENNLEFDDEQNDEFPDHTTPPTKLPERTTRSHLPDMTTGHSETYMKSNRTIATSYSHSKEFSFSGYFSNSEEFSYSNVFSETEYFSKSDIFTISSQFSQSQEFSHSFYFTFSKMFSQSQDFSDSFEFSISSDFSQSDDFSQSFDFSTSKVFTFSIEFSGSFIFSNTDVFSKSTQFTQSDDFTISEAFTESNVFHPTEHFGETDEFTESSAFTLSSHFSHSNNFTKSLSFSNSEAFSVSKIFSSSDHFSHSLYFTQSNAFIKSSDFSESNHFSNSLMFSSSCQFSNSNQFSNSKQFSHSHQFSKSFDFTQSKIFSPSMKFSKSDIFLQSDEFSQSDIFSKSDKFSQSDKFTHSDKFTNSDKFTHSDKFTQSDEFSISMAFSQSSGFTKSSDFSEKFTPKFRPTIVFNASNIFTLSSSFTASLSGKFTASNSFSPSLDFLNINIDGKNKDNDIGLTTIIGIVVGVIAAILLIGFLIWFCKRKKEESEEEMDNEEVISIDDKTVTVHTENPLWVNRYLDDTDDPFKADFEESLSLLTSQE